MPPETALKAITFVLIWFLFLLAFVVLLLSQAKEYHTGQPFRHAFTFALAVLALCAMIGLGAISARAQRASSFLILFDRG